MYHTWEPSLRPCSPGFSSVVRVSNRSSGRSWVQLLLGNSKFIFQVISTWECFFTYFTLDSLLEWSRRQVKSAGFMTLSLSCGSMWTSLFNLERLLSLSSEFDTKYGSPFSRTTLTHSTEHWQRSKGFEQNLSMTFAHAIVQYFSVFEFKLSQMLFYLFIFQCHWLLGAYWRFFIALALLGLAWWHFLVILIILVAEGPTNYWDFKARNFRWNPANSMIISKPKKLAYPIDVTNRLGSRSLVARLWTRTSQLQRFIVVRIWLISSFF